MITRNDLIVNPIANLEVIIIDKVTKYYIFFDKKVKIY